jgi:hypothetical protein
VPFTAKVFLPMGWWFYLSNTVSYSYSIQQYVIKFVSDLRQVGCFLRLPPVKLTHDITEILLKVTLNIITLAHIFKDQLAVLI